MADQVENFTLESLAGDPVSLSGSLVGKRGALVVFWSSVCSHCQRYDGYLNAFVAEHPEIGLVVVACREGESTDDLRRVASERRLEFPIHADPERDLAHAWRVHQTPRVFLVSTELETLYRGAIDNFTYPEDPLHASYLETALAEHLAGGSIARSETSSFGCAIESVYYRERES